MSAPPAPPSVHPDFDDSKADITLISSDKLASLNVRRYQLQAASQTFDDMVDGRRTSQEAIQGREDQHGSRRNRCGARAVLEIRCQRCSQTEESRDGANHQVRKGIELNGFFLLPPR